jgi:hypothetical protein
MPTVMRAGGFRFFFYSTDRSEPPHVHVRSGRRTAKIWLDPVQVDSSSRFSESELGRILKLARESRRILLRNWNEYFHHPG